MNGKLNLQAVIIKKLRTLRNRSVIALMCDTKGVSTQLK